MKNEIFSWGPIVCGIHASKAFHEYKGGILSEISIAPKIDHYVEILGWGEENGKKYWLGRNSWGTSWGESSFFRIQMGSNNLGIETHCYFGNSFMWYWFRIYHFVCYVSTLLLQRTRMYMSTLSSFMTLRHPFLLHQSTTAGFKMLFPSDL